jgi:putative exosortase-associated protein (TIGR04073 family)
MKKILVSLVLVSAVVLSNVVNAEQEATKEKATQTKREGFNIFKSFRKGGRGLTNIALSPFEIPNQMVKEAKRHDTIGGATAGYFAGIPIGCGWMVYRLGVGVFDFVTGPIPTPTYEKSYIEPEYLFPQDPYSPQ